MLFFQDTWSMNYYFRQHHAQKKSMEIYLKKFVFKIENATSKIFHDIVMLVVVPQVSAQPTFSKSQSQCEISCPHQLLPMAYHRFPPSYRLCSSLLITSFPSGGFPTLFSDGPVCFHFSSPIHGID